MDHRDMDHRTMPTLASLRGGSTLYRVAQDYKLPDGRCGTNITYAEADSSREAIDKVQAAWRTIHPDIRFDGGYCEVSAWNKRRQQ